MARVLSSPLPLAFAGFVVAGLLVERDAGSLGELGLGLLTWVVLLAACRRLDRGERRRVAALVAVASAGEVLGSLILQLYAYRRGGIPLFVPPGHGLVFLAGRRLATWRRPRALVALSIAVTVGWGAARVLTGAPPDAIGMIAAAALIAVVLRSRRAALFAAMVLVVDGLELYGTALGYVGFDWVALRITRPAGSRTASCQPPRWAIRSSAASPAST